MFNTIEQLMSEGRHREALVQLKEISAQPLDVVETLKCKMLISGCTRFIGEYTEALKLAREVIETSREQPKVYWIGIDAMIQEAHCLLLLNQHDESLVKVEEIFKSLKPKDAPHRKSKLMRIKGWIRLRQGLTDKAQVCAYRSMELGEDLEDDDIIAYSCQLLGAIYSSTYDFEQAVRYTSRGLEIRERQENIPLSIDFHINLGVLYSDSGELDSALKHFEKALELVKKDRNEVRIGQILGNIGYVQYLKGHLDMAQKYTKESLLIHKKAGHIRGIATTSGLIGRIYRELGEFERAFEYLEQGLQMYKDMGMELKAYEDVFELFITATESKSTNRMNQYFKQLEGLGKKLDTPWTREILHLAEALILRSKGRYRDRAKAEDILLEVAYREIINPQYRIRALQNLCGLLLEEFKDSEDSEILQEIREHVDVLSELAREQNSHWILAESFVLKSKLALLEPDYQEASMYLTKAQRIAEDRGLGLLAIKISNEHDELLENKPEWEELKDNSAILDRLELSKIDKQLNDMYKKGLADESETHNEEPILFMVINAGGLCVYSKTFSSSKAVNKDVIAGFLNAIQGFSDEFFSQSLDRIRLESYTLLVRLDDQMTFCYVFKGHSYNALQKLSKFIDILKNNSSLQKSFRECDTTGKTLGFDIQLSVDHIIDQVFMVEQIYKQN